MTARNSLAPGYKLHWYLIKDTLGQGGFGITYLAEDTNLNHLVAIKEFLPIEMAVRESDASVRPVSGEQGDDYRWGLDRFISEARTLARFRHHNVVRVLTVFTENNTAYMIMEYEHGRGLHEILKEKGRLSEREVFLIMMPILDGLEHVHAAGFIHRDIKPPNIYIRDDGSPVLLDFGSARQSLGEHTRTLTTMVSPGYAPFEQYVSKSDKQGPWTDIYGLGATMYRAVTGKSPPNAVDRSEAILHTGKDIYVPVVDVCRENYSHILLQAIDHALAFKAGERPPDIATWRGEMTGEPDARIDEDETELLPQTSEPAVADTDGIQTVRITPPTVPEADATTTDETIKLEGTKWINRGIRIIKVLILITIIIAVLIVFKNLSGKRNEGSFPDTSGTGIESVRPQSDKADRTDHTSDRPLVTDKEITATGKVTVKVNDTPAITSRSSQAPLPETQKRSDLISNSDLRRLAVLRERLRTNPNDRTSVRHLRTMLNDFSTKVKNALNEGDLDTAEAYVKEIMELAPDNERMKQALEKIRKARVRQRSD